MDFTELIKQLLYIFLTAALPIIVKYITYAVKSYEVNTDNKIINNCIEQVKETVTNAVLTINQTYVDNLKKNGEFTKEAQDAAFNKAKETALLLICDDARNIVRAVYGDFDTFLTTQIESAVHSCKSGGAS